MTRNLLKLTFQPWRPHRRGRGRFWLLLVVVLALLAGGGFFAETGLSGVEMDVAVTAQVPFRCLNPHVADGDTITCAGFRVRLQGIDAPEIEGHCRAGRSCVAGDPLASRDYLIDLTRGEVVCNPVETDHYGRIVARCSAGGRDLSCAMITGKQAVRRYGFITCP